MIPGGRLSTTPVRGRLLNPWSRNDRISLHRGPVALSDGSAGLAVRMWRLRALPGGLHLGPEDGAESLLLAVPGAISECSLAFDQLGRPSAAFVEDGVPKLYWYDTQVASFVTTTLAAGTVNPRITLDDPRATQSANSDIILAYVRAGALYYRQQRDRFLTEYLLANAVTSLEHVSISSAGRLQFILDGSEATDEEWTLGDLVQDLGRQVGIESQRMLPGQSMYTDPVIGFATTPESPQSEHLRVLAQAYRFDAQATDGLLKFEPRGGPAVAVVTEEQFTEAESEPESDTTRDAISVPRLLHLMYFDVVGGQSADKQQSERELSPRSESPTVLSTPVIMTAEQAARAVSVQHRIMEEELRGELVFGLSDQYVRIAEADVIIVQYRGRSQRCRVTKAEIMDGWQRITAVRDRQSAYTAQVEPIPPAVITTPPSTIPGGTRFAFLDLPALTQGGDALGYYIATSGETTSWRGAVVEREEVGAQFAVLATDGVGTIMGTLTQALALASEHYSDETNAITVQLARADDDLASITREVWLSRGNAAALMRADGSAEVVQFREAVETTPGTWRLTGLLRGRLNSGASAHAAGAVFVLLDGVLRIAAPSERIGATINHRAYSVGNDVSTAISQARTWSGRSQREWPPIIDSASRAADTVSVSWTPRHRFGSDQSPVASSHFDGWRVEASSGGVTVGIDTLTPAASISVVGMSNPITVTVRGRNRLAGLGDAATRIIP